MPFCADRMYGFQFIVIVHLSVQWQVWLTCNSFDIWWNKIWFFIFLISFWHWSFYQEEVAKELGVPVQYLRFWLWAKRQNHTYRPNRPLTPQEETQSVSTSPNLKYCVTVHKLHGGRHAFILSMISLFVTLCISSFFSFLFYFFLMISIPRNLKASLSALCHNIVAFFVHANGNCFTSLLFWNAKWRGEINFFVLCWEYKVGLVLE